MAFRGRKLWVAAVLCWFDFPPGFWDNRVHFGGIHVAL